MAKNKKINKTDEEMEKEILARTAAQDEIRNQHGGTFEMAKPTEKKSIFSTPGELEKQTRNDSAVQAQMKADEKAKPDNLKIDEDRKFGTGAKQMKQNVEDFEEAKKREMKEFEDAVNKEPGAESLVKSGDELKDQINQQVGAVEGQVNAPEVNEAESEVTESTPENTESENTIDNNTETNAVENKAEENIEPKVEPETPIEPSNEAVSDDFYKKYVDEYYGPKNGADYLKSLWSQGAGGKAAAIGNVLGNIMGAVGKGAAGQDYTSDWEQYRNNYVKAQQERNQRAFNDNMDIVKQLRQNDTARGELLKTMELMKKVGKIKPEEFEAIRKGMAATGKSSQMDYFLASILGNLAGDKDFAEAVKGMGEESMKLLSNIAGFAGNTVGGINRFFGGGR